MTTTTLYKSPAGEQAVLAMYAAALKNWSVPYDTCTVSTRHGETFVIASGDAHSPALILLHGAGSNSTVWAADVRDYAMRYRVYAVDLIGEAGKSAPNRPAWDGPAFAEWLEDVVNGLGIQQVTLVGISQGGWTALKFAVYAPERVEKLALLTPGGVVPDRASFLLRAVGLSMLGAWGIKRFMRALFADQNVPAGVTEIVVQMSSQFKPRIGVLPIFTDDELRRLTMPTLLLGGTKDIARDVDKIAARLRTLLPHVTAKFQQGAGHALLNTSGCVMDFLTQ